jgi:hypothetical protein
MARHEENPRRFRPRPVSPGPGGSVADDTAPAHAMWRMVLELGRLVVGGGFHDRQTTRATTPPISSSNEGRKAARGGWLLNVVALGNNKVAGARTSAGRRSIPGSVEGRAAAVTGDTTRRARETTPPT